MPTLSKRPCRNHSTTVRGKRQRNAASNPDGNDPVSGYGHVGADRSWHATAVDVPAQQRKPHDYSLIRTEVDLGPSALNVGNAIPQPLPDTDYETESHVVCTPMDIDTVCLDSPVMTGSYSAVAEETRARQPSTPPHSTQQPRQGSGDNDGEEHTSYGGDDGDGARDDIVAGGVRGGAASQLPAQEHAPANHPGLSVTHTSAVDPNNGPDHESQVNFLAKRLILIEEQQENKQAEQCHQRARQDNLEAEQGRQKAHQNEQDIRLSNLETRQGKNDANSLIIKEGIVEIKSILEKDRDRSLEVAKDHEDSLRC